MPWHAARISPLPCRYGEAYSKGEYCAALRRCISSHCVIAAVFGFGGIAAGAVGIAKILFFVFIVLAVISFLMGLLKK